MEQLTKNQAVATSQEAVQNQNEPQLRDENAHNDKSVHGVLNPTYQAGLRRDAVQPDIEAEQTQNQRYGSSHIGATAKDISNVVTDAASGVVDIFHGIDKAVADTWNNFWKDGKADGIGSNLSRK